MDRKYLRPLLVALILILAVCLGLELAQARQKPLPQDADDLAQDLPLAVTTGGSPAPESSPETKPIETEITPVTDLTPPDEPTETAEATETTAVTEATEATQKEETPDYTLPPNMLPIG